MQQNGFVILLFQTFCTMQAVLQWPLCCSCHKMYIVNNICFAGSVIKVESQKYLTLLSDTWL